MFDPALSLLPRSATDLAKAFDILEERLFELPVEMITKDPWSVSESLLDHLAWEYSVDAWDTDWPVELKRKIISTSSVVHQYKGTPYAVKEAMSVFGVELELIEWWQDGGSGVPGTFRVRAYVSNPVEGEDALLSDAALISAMQKVINASAPVSRGWGLELGAKIDAPVYGGAFSHTAIFAEALADIPPAPDVTAQSGYAVVATTRISSEIGG
jgi:phage tail P2-like protein